MSLPSKERSNLTIIIILKKVFGAIKAECFFFAISEKHKVNHQETSSI
mgnify:CR=1 FL=1